MKSTIVCGLVVASLLAAACSRSPNQEQEVEMGAADAAQVDSELPLLHDTVVTAFVTALGRSMASRTSRADLDWHFRVINSANVNAFALPGGYIYINRGAIEQADRLDELAGIMGHEIGHVVLRHAVDQMQHKRKEELKVLAVCTLTHVCMTTGGRIAVGVTADAKAAHYSQRDEAQADSDGVLNTLHAGIDPEGLPSFFQKLLDTSAQQPSLVEAFFSTHPTDQARITATRQQLTDLPRTDRALIRDSPEFHTVQARVRALPAPPKTQ